uniref:TNFR-Cys domain-containing protein n=1 Tax=Pavo cristatus TaxID=9049 RepID=A0A8C9EY56_PAVCR
QPPGCQDCSMLRSQQGLVLPPNRPRRSTVKPSCPSGMSWMLSAGRCCTQCPPGEKCPAGTAPCTRCVACHQHGGMALPGHAAVAALIVLLLNCSATSNIACGCESGYFRDCQNKDDSCSDFSCKKCKTCPGKLLLQPCSDRQDAQCGSCKPEFYAEGSECRPCHT